MNIARRTLTVAGSHYLLGFLVLLVCFFSSACDAKKKGATINRDSFASSAAYLGRARTQPINTIVDQDKPYIKKINLVYSSHADEIHDRDTPSPPGWDSYDGSRYTPQRGYGWLIDLLGYGRDRGIAGNVVLADGTKTSPRELGRPELANFQGKHDESDLLVFRIDVPDGWYRISCASVDPDSSTGKPLVDQRTFKCRAHDVVFAGANYGSPTLAGGRRLIEGHGIVEATDGHLRIVVGDPAYAGWTWSHPGPWNKRWQRWWYNESKYAKGWWQVLTRKVDPGFHFLTLNALEIERVRPPKARPPLIFRDYFNRDDHPDINYGVAEQNRWLRVNLHARLPDLHDASLHATSIRLAGPPEGASVSGLLQQQTSPAAGIIRYSTRLSLFTGTGSRKHSGSQEAGVVLLAEPGATNDFNSTFVGVRFDGNTAGAKGALVYRVGDGNKGFRTRADIPEGSLPLRITEGEYEIVIEHDVSRNILRRIQINGIDLTDRWSVAERTQRVAQGRFGLRSAITNDSRRANVRQYYWFYRVERLT
jgi:hypothetical protein